MISRKSHVQMGVCKACNTVQTVNLVGDPDLTEPKAENFLVGYHTNPGSAACDGFNKPPNSLYFPQGAAAFAKEEDLDFGQFELTRDGEYAPADGEDDHSPDEHGPMAL